MTDTPDKPFSYQVLERDEFLTVAVSGRPTKSDLKGVLDAITVDGTIMHSRRLWDLRECDLNLPSNELMELASIARSRDPDSGRGAILVGKDLTFGLLRIYKAFRESESNDVMVFRDEDEAIDWIRR